MDFNGTNLVDIQSVDSRQMKTPYTTTTRSNVLQPSTTEKFSSIANDAKFSTIGTTKSKSKTHTSTGTSFIQHTTTTIGRLPNPTTKTEYSTSIASIRKESTTITVAVSQFSTKITTTSVHFPNTTIKFDSNANDTIEELLRELPFARQILDDITEEPEKGR